MAGPPENTGLSRRLAALRGRIGAGVLALSCAAMPPLLAAPAPAVAQSSDIPWNATVVISRNATNDDIRAVLRSILQANGLSVVFGPNVEGPVSFQLDRVPIAVAFQQLVDRYNLAYSYDPTSRTVMVTARSGQSGALAPRRVELPLEPAEYGRFSEALLNLGLGLGGVGYDEFGHTVTVSGDQARVNRVLDVLTAMRPELRAEIGGEQARAAVRETVRAEADRPVQLIAPPPPTREPTEVEVIGLRFAGVGPTQRTFQGETVTVPGVSDTLYDLVRQDYQLSEYDQPPPRISMDQRTNSVVVQGTRKQIDDVADIIRALDRPLQMVQIEVIIASADIGVARQLGVAWRGSLLATTDSPASVGVDTGTSGGVVGVPDGGGRFDSDGLDALSLLPAGPGATSASFVIRGGEAVLQAQLQALARQNQARILSAPRLVTMDNVTARITRAQNLYVQVDTRLEGGGTGSVGLEEIQTGLTLEITPSIVPADSPDGQSQVRLDLRAENSAPGGGVLGQIDVRSQEVQTNVLVPDGATFVVGGLFDDSQVLGQSGVPILQDVPVLGSLFRTTRQQKAMGETIFFITPRLVNEQTVSQSDIAVRVGSQDYMDRQRRFLGDQYQYDLIDREGHRVAPRIGEPPSLTGLEEDE